MQLCGAALGQLTGLAALAGIGDQQRIRLDVRHAASLLIAVPVAQAQGCIGEDDQHCRDFAGWLPPKQAGAKQQAGRQRRNVEKAGAG